LYGTQAKVLRALGAANGLYGLVHCTSADGNGLHFALLARELGKHGARAATKAILNQNDVSSVERLLCYIFELVVGTTSTILTYVVAADRSKTISVDSMGTVVVLERLVWFVVLVQNV
jgi:hypothetical protein